ncbi:hypothetical protein Q1695_003516 [Nippostrongylus brasiliensis]|nr:hypothetical protein Q1695_003516 [Nippostrongylus brasiliensis]
MLIVILFVLYIFTITFPISLKCAKGNADQSKKTTKDANKQKAGSKSGSSTASRSSSSVSKKNDKKSKGKPAFEGFNIKKEEEEPKTDLRSLDEDSPFFSIKERKDKKEKDPMEPKLQEMEVKAPTEAMITRSAYAKPTVKK